MVLRDIWTVAKKELKAGFADKIILFQIVFMPFLIVYGFSLLMMVTSQAGITENEDGSVKAYYVNAPEYMTDGLMGLKLQAVEANKTADIKEDVANEKSSLLVVFPEDFAFANGTGAVLSNIDIWYNSANAQSIQLYNVVNVYLSAYQPKAFSVNAAQGITYDLGDEDAAMRELLSMMMPIILLMAVFMVCMNLSAESVAGDKERGFLNTMLIAPVKRSSIASGKALFVGIISVIGGVSAFIGTALSLPKLADTLGMEGGFSYKPMEYLLLFAVTMTGVFVLAAVLLVISTLAKDVKQATNVAPAIMTVLMVVGMLATTESFKQSIAELGMINAVIPAWNTMLNMQDILKLDYSADRILVSCGVNILCSLLAVFVVGKCFESESIVNG